jgi:hypothetical protein
MSLFIAALLAGFLLYQIVSFIQPIAGTRTYRVGRRVIVQLPESTYLAWKAGSIAGSIILFVLVVTLIIAQNVHPAEGYAYRFVDALTSPRMAAAVFGGLVGLLVGNLLNRILQNASDYKFTSSDRLEIILIFFLVILGIGGEELVQSYARRVSKISLGTTTEISFSDSRAKASRNAAEQPGNAYKQTDSKQASGAGVLSGSAGLEKLKVLSFNIQRDKDFIAVLSLYEGNRTVLLMPASIMLATEVLSPIGSCLSDIFALNGDGDFINIQLTQLREAIQALDPNAPEPQQALNILKDQVKVVSQYAQKILPSLTKNLPATSSLPRKPCADVIESNANRATIFANAEEISAFARDADTLPYAAMTYASIMAALQHYDSAAITLHNWIAQHQHADTIEKKWYLLRARFALSVFLDEWIRQRGATTSSWLRLYHIENLKSIVHVMQSFKAIWALSNQNRDYKKTVGLLGASQSGDEGLCKFPPVVQALADEQRTLMSIYESYLSARSSYVDHALKHPIMKRKLAAIIDSEIQDLITLDLKCIAPSIRANTRAEYLERYVRNEINLLENTSTLKSTDEIRNRIRAAQQLLGLALQLIEPKVTTARDMKSSTTDLQMRITQEPILELYETLLATQDQLEEFSERDSVQ